MNLRYFHQIYALRFLSDNNATEVKYRGSGSAGVRVCGCAQARTWAQALVWAAPPPAMVVLLSAPDGKLVELRYGMWRLHLAP